MMSPRVKETAINVTCLIVSALSALGVALLLPGLVFGADGEGPRSSIDAVLLMVTSGAISALLTVVIFRLFSIGKKGDKTAEDLSQLQQNLPIDYVRTTAFKEWESKMDRKINKLFNLFRETVGGGKDEG